MGHSSRFHIRADSTFEQIPHCNAAKPLSAVIPAKPESRYLYLKLNVLSGN
jgi:hypothetical protein